MKALKLDYADLDAFVKSTTEMEEKHTMTRKEILDAAAGCVCGQREKDYGSPEDNFETIGYLWSVYLRAAHPKLCTQMGVNGINAKDVSMMMALLKIARVATGTATADSFIDLAGYAACGGEITSTEALEHV